MVCNQCVDVGCVHIHVVLLNYAQIKVAYGEYSAGRFVRDIQERFFLQGGSVYVTDNNSFVVSIANQTCDLLEDTYLSISVTPVVVDDIRVLPVVSLSLLDAASVESYKMSSMVSSAVCVGATIKPAKLDHKWRASYERDMSMCVELMSRLGTRQGSLQRQPVNSIVTGTVLYEEAFLRFDGDENIQSLCFAEYIEAVKNIGIQKIVDMYVMNTVLNQLERESGVSIGCNLSASSFILDKLWARAFKRLASNPDMACRLVIELTEEEPMEDIDAALDFIEKLRGLGCRFALDDLGAGMSRTTVIERAKFEFIKIDKSLLHSARHTAAGKSMLKHTVDYCKLFSKEIIVEGMETLEDMHEVMSVGVTAGQGFYFNTKEKKSKISIAYTEAHNKVFPLINLVV